MTGLPEGIFNLIATTLQAERSTGAVRNYSLPAGDTKLKTELRGLSPRENYTGRAIAAYRQS
jgi:hypothetical protein